MTVLVTVDGDLQVVTRDTAQTGPWQTSSSGRPLLAQGSAPLAAFGSGQLTMIGGRTVSFTELYRTQPMVAAAVNLLTEQIARLPLKVYELNSQGDRERVRDHRLAKLLSRPAPRRAAIQLKQWAMLPMLLHGNAVLVKGRESAGAPPSRLWPLDWRHLVPRTDSGGEIDHWETSEFGGRWFLDRDDVIHLRWEAPDGPVGVSPLQQLGVTLRTEQAAQRYQESYLGKSARPPSAIQAPTGVALSPEIRAEIRADLERIYGGPENAGRPALLPEGLEWKGIGHNAQEAELIAQRELSAEEVARVYQIPQPMVGLLKHGTYSNVAELHRMFFTTVMGPWLTLLEESIEAQLIDGEPAFEGVFVEFDLAEVLKGDKLKEINALKIAVQAGLLTLNEARQVLNLPGFDAAWCDQPLIPANNLRSAPEPDLPPDGGDPEMQALVESLAAAGNGNH